MKRCTWWAMFPLIGAIAVMGCQKDDIAQRPLVEEAQSAMPYGTVEQGIEQMELSSLMAKYGGLPSGYEAQRNQLPPYSVWRAEDLPTGPELAQFCPPIPLDADSVEWVAVISDVDSLVEGPASAWGSQELAMVQGMMAAYSIGADARYGFNKAGDGSKHPPKKFPDDDDGGDWDDISEPPTTPTEPPEPTGIGDHVVEGKWAMNGDIYVKRETSSSSSSSSMSSNTEMTPNESSVNFIIPGYWKHAAMMDLDYRKWYGKNRCLLSASNRTDSFKAHRKSMGGDTIIVGRVGYDPFDDYWSVADEIGVYRVGGATDNERMFAVIHARRYNKRAFHFKTDRGDDDYFYCSKLVWRGWKFVGYDLEPKVNSVTGLPWFWRIEFWRWNYKTILGIRIRYPEFKKVWYRDTWVTPTDLTKTDYTYQLKRYKR